MKTSLVVRHFPDRQKPCLMLEQDTQGFVLGTFRNEACAQMFQKFLGGYGIAKDIDQTIEELLDD